jgi:hypothetical protein
MRTITRVAGLANAHDGSGLANAHDGSGLANAHDGSGLANAHQEFHRQLVNQF